jgi:hypothetical protein
MKLTLSVFLAIALLVTGVPQASCTENSPKIAAYAGIANRSMFKETPDNYIDDRIFVSFSLASAARLTEPFPIAASFDWHAWDEKNLIKKYFKIYKLTSAYLI